MLGATSGRYFLEVQVTATHLYLSDLTNYVQANIMKNERLKKREKKSFIMVFSSIQCSHEKKCFMMDKMEMEDDMLYIMVHYRKLIQCK